MYFTSGNATIRIALDAWGKVTNAVVIKTTGFAQVDASAIQAAKDAQYQAANVDGQAVGRDYIGRDYLVDVAFDL